VCAATSTLPDLINRFFLKKQNNTFVPPTIRALFKFLVVVFFIISKSISSRSSFFSGFLYGVKPKEN
jgi:hypothetical protein